MASMNKEGTGFNAHSTRKLQKSLIKIYDHINSLLIDITQIDIN